MVGWLLRHVRWVIVLCVALAIILGIGYWLSLPTTFPITSVQFYGDYRYVTPKRLQSAIEPFVDHAGFFSLNTTGIESQLDDIVAIDGVEVRRHWPNTLAIRLQSRKPIAVWNGKQLMSADGSVFAATQTDSWRALPHFVGNKKQIDAMLDFYQKTAPGLLNLHLYVRTFVMTDSGGVELQLIPGRFWVYLGSEQTGSKLAHFESIYPDLMRHAPPRHQLAYIDLRYTRGFAVYWRK